MRQNRLHVDAAYAGVTAMLPEMRAHFAGIELADSFNTNPHKWLLTNMDCSCLWVADATYVRAALSLLPAYLRGRGNDLDYKVCARALDMSSLRHVRVLLLVLLQRTLVGGRELCSLCWLLEWCACAGG